MNIGRLVLLGVFALGASVSAEAATAPRLHAPGVATHASLSKDKKKHSAHAHKVQKHKVAHAHIKKVKKVKKS